MVVRGVTQSRTTQRYRAGGIAVVALTIALIRDTYSNTMTTLNRLIDILRILRDELGEEGIGRDHSGAAKCEGIE